ncbi:MAG TPA: DEAD/DEAH box helicase, partial [Thermoleophilia bacterium]|nr:DEAD/DEAH box helicase [Thermoleophilia bacterium]
MLTPRPYQIDAMAAFMAGVDKGIRRQLIVLPTGTGKTLTALLLARQIGGPILWLAHRDELIQQPIKAVATVWPEASRGIVKAARDEWDRDIVFASIQTAARPRRLETLAKRDWKLVVVDEGHHAPSASWRRVVSGLGCLSPSGPPLLGLTATPERLDSARLDDIFERVSYQYHLGQAIKDGYLARPDIVFEPIKVDLGGIATRGGDFDPKSLDLALLEGGIVESIRQVGQKHMIGRKSLIFTVSVNQATMVAEALRGDGIAAASIDGTMDLDERRYLLRKFSSGEITALANCAILTEGFDEPTIDCIVMARPTQSKSLFIQCAGRGLRLSPGKDSCRIVDMVALSGRHSLVQAPVIFGTELEEETREKREKVLLKVDPIEYWKQRLSTQIMGLRSISRSDMRWIRGNAGELLLGVGSIGTVRL